MEKQITGVATEGIGAWPLINKEYGVWQDL